MLLILWPQIPGRRPHDGLKDRDAGGLRPGKWLLLHEAATFAGRIDALPVGTC
jgi:hypothetical protein